MRNVVELVTVSGICAFCMCLYGKNCDRNDTRSEESLSFVTGNIR